MPFTQYLHMNKTAYLINERGNKHAIEIIHQSMNLNFTFTPNHQTLDAHYLSSQDAIRSFAGKMIAVTPSSDIFAPGANFIQIGTHGRGYDNLPWFVFTRHVFVLGAVWVIQ